MRPNLRSTASGTLTYNLAHTYAEALHERYLWHEFGDSHLLVA